MIGSARGDAAPSLQPVAPGERIHALDVLRGVALFGVLLAYTVWNLGGPPEETYGALDRALAWVLPALVDSKFYTLFAFLFGLGFSIQMARAQARGMTVVPVYCRRLLVLLGIGLAHAFLLRNGDILVPYATMGFILLLFRHASNRVILLGGIVGFIFPYFARGVWEASGAPFPARPDAHGPGYLAENAAWVRYWYSIAITVWPASLPMFLFGLYLGRRRFFENLPAQRARLRATLILGLLVGAAAYALRIALIARHEDGAPSFARLTTWRLLWNAHAFGLAACYASSVLLLAQRPGWARLLAPIGAVGRMALTNYLLQALIVVPVCLGLDLFDRVRPGLGVLLALAVWTVQVPASVWWLGRFRFGPVEWVWRSLTYGRVMNRSRPRIDAGMRRC